MIYEHEQSLKIYVFQGLLYFIFSFLVEVKCNHIKNAADVAKVSLSYLTPLIQSIRAAKLQIFNVHSDLRSVLFEKGIPLNAKAQEMLMNINQRDPKVNCLHKGPTIDNIGFFESAHNANCLNKVNFVRIHFGSEAQNACDLCFHYLRIKHLVSRYAVKFFRNTDRSIKRIFCEPKILRCLHKPIHDFHQIKTLFVFSANFEFILNYEESKEKIHNESIMEQKWDYLACKQSSFQEFIEQSLFRAISVGCAHFFTLSWFLNNLVFLRRGLGS